jgi:anti-anti-sigma factor
VTPRAVRLNPRPTVSENHDNSHRVRRRPHSAGHAVARSSGPRGTPLQGAQRGAGHSSNRRDGTLSSLRLEQISDSTTVHLALNGELDLAAGDLVRRRLCDLGNLTQHVVVDLSGVTFVDCSGLRAVVEALQATEPGSCRIEVSPECSAPLLRLVELIRSARLADRLPGLDRFFPRIQETGRTTL